METTPSLSAREIRQLRLKLGLSQRQFAQLLDTTVTTLARWELGRNAPRPRHQAALQQIRIHLALLKANRMKVLHGVLQGLQCGLKLELLLRPEILSRLAHEGLPALDVLSEIAGVQPQKRGQS